MDGDFRCCVIHAKTLKRGDGMADLTINCPTCKENILVSPNIKGDAINITEHMDDKDVYCSSCDQNFIVYTNFLKS